jgi:two-component system sensor kinase FixL
LAALLIAWLRRGRQRRGAAEDELKESEGRYRAIFETAVDAIIVSNQHGIIEEFSKAAERMTGYLAAEVTGRNMRVLLPANLRQEHDRYTARYLWTVREMEVCRKDGTLFPAHLSIAEWWAGGHRHFTGILRDLTQSGTLKDQAGTTAPSPENGGHRQSDGGMAHDFNKL